MDAYKDTAKAKLKKKGFTEKEIETLSERGWPPARVLKEIERLIDEGYTSEQYAREGFEEIYPELFSEEWRGHNAADIFQTLGFYQVPALTEEERKPPEFLIEGMLPCGMTFLSGAPKIRKSFLALQIAIAVATGEPIFNHRTLQSDVAYFDLEGSKSRIASRTQRMTAKMPSNVFVTNSTEYKLSDELPSAIRSLHLQRPQMRLYIIDTYSRARGRVKADGANAYDSDVSFLEPIQRMALEENIAILFVHHHKKGAGMMSDSFERLSGTMGISGSADCVMNLDAEGKRFEGKAILEYTPRDAKGGELSLEFDEYHLEWHEALNTKPDIHGNPVCGWILENIPEKSREGVFYPYELVFREAYHSSVDSPGSKIREQVELFKAELYNEYGVGVQLGVQSNCKRGLRLYNSQ